MNTIVLKPSEAQDGDRPPYFHIIENRVAERFAVSPDRVNHMTYIIIVDGNNHGVIALINRPVVPEDPDTEGGLRRSTIHFRNPHTIQNPDNFLEFKGVRWSQNNRRYIQLTVEDLNLIEFPEQAHN